MHVQVGLITSSLIYVDFSSCAETGAAPDSKAFQTKVAELVRALGQRGRDPLQSIPV